MSIKDLGKKILKRSINKRIPLKVKLESDGENIIITTLDKSIPKSYMELKHRRTGQRLEEKIVNSSVKFPISELLEISTLGIYDVFIKVRENKLNVKRRIKFVPENQFFKVTYKNERRIIKAYATNHNNLSLKVERRNFDYNIKSIESIENERILIKGELQTLNEEIEEIHALKIIGRNRLDSQSNVFDVDFEVLDKEEGKYTFEGIIDEIKIESEEKIINLRMDFYIRLFNQDGIYYQNLIDLSNYRSFENDEDRFLVKVDTEENVYSYYATEKKYSLALWITTETSYEKSYAIAGGRTIYNNASKQPIDENMVFFESFFGKAYSGNPKYIYEKMLEMGLDKKYTFVWAYSGENPEIIPGNPIIVERYKAGDYYKYLALSKYWVNNIIFPIHAKRPGNVYLQTWHGTPLKKLGYDITIPGPEVEGRANFYAESRNWDYLISSNKYSTEIFERAFKYNKKFLELGYPINDIFFKDNTKKVEGLKTKLNIPKDKKVILYAPTWKDDEKNASWEHFFNLEIDLERLYDKFKDEYVFLLKMHHLVSENLVIDEKMKDFAIDLSDYDDIQELYIMSDILITDYSSVFFDYAHSRRPILFFVPDLNHYIENVRGLYLNMEKELPGPLIKDNDELIDILDNMDKVSDDYKERYDEFYERFCSLCTGDSSEKIVKKIFN